MSDYRQAEPQHRTRIGPTHQTTRISQIDVLDHFDLDPVAYYYHSYNAMIDDWVDTVRLSANTIDPNADDIRNVTPLIPLEDVEALLDELGVRAVD
jgi:hypothetical protein